MPPAASGRNVMPQNPQPAAAPAMRVAPAPIQTQAFPAQPPPVRPRFIYAFGQRWDIARAKLDDFTKPPDAAASGSARATQGAQDAMKGAAQAATNAVDVRNRLPSVRPIDVHERCAVAQKNGAWVAAAKVCRVKGFGDLHRVNVQSSENCPPAVSMSGLNIGAPARRGSRS
jgi:hypothetical protein